MGRQYTNEQQPTITAGAYSAGDVIGGLLTFPVATNNGGILREIRISDADNIKAATTLYFFDQGTAAPTAILDNAAFATGLTLADKDRIMFTVDVAGADYETINADAIAIEDGLSNRFTNSSRLYCYEVTGATPTFVATDSRKIQITYERIP